MSKLGGYNNVPNDFMDITFEHLRTTGCRARIYMLDNESLIISWLQKRRLIRKNVFCSACQCPKNLTKDSETVLGYTSTCPNPGNVHREAIFKFSYFENCRFKVRDIIDFILNYLNGLSLYKCKNLAGISQDHTSVNYAQFIGR